MELARKHGEAIRNGDEWTTREVHARVGEQANPLQRWILGRGCVRLLALLPPPVFPGDPRRKRQRTGEWSKTHPREQSRDPAPMTDPHRVTSLSERPEMVSRGSPASPSVAQVSTAHQLKRGKPAPGYVQPWAASEAMTSAPCLTLVGSGAARARPENTATPLVRGRRLRHQQVGQRRGDDVRASTVLRIRPEEPSMLAARDVSRDSLQRVFSLRLLAHPSQNRLGMTDDGAVGKFERRELLRPGRLK
jgi:hypothetical protein